MCQYFYLYRKLRLSRQKYSKFFSFWDFALQTPDRNFAAGLHWGTELPTPASVSYGLTHQRRLFHRSMNPACVRETQGTKIIHILMKVRSEKVKHNNYICTRPICSSSLIFLNSFLARYAHSIVFYPPFRNKGMQPLQSDINKPNYRLRRLL